jgi:protein-disulfide isomerase
MEKSNSLVSTPVAILIGAVLISLSVLISGGTIKIKGFNSGATNPGAAAPGETENTAPLPEPSIGPVKVSLDDDPVLGDKNAPVTLVEFSDYECPFCKRHYDQTYLQLKTNYIDKGKVKLVYRDLPLSFHDPMATTEAIAANCARDQGGDSAYFKFHDTIFEKTTSNGNGLTKDQLYQFATDQGLNQANFKACLDSEKFKDEVSKDLADAGNAGATGTPSFIIGKSTGAEIEGKLIVGAQPYSVFQAEIDILLQ